MANLIEKELGVDLGKCSLETLSERLPKLLIEDLEMAQNFEMHVNGDEVRFKFDESIYSDFCHKLSRTESTLATSLGEGPPVTLIIISAPPDDWAKPYFTRNLSAAFTASGSKDDSPARSRLVCHLPSLARNHNSSTTVASRATFNTPSTDPPDKRRFETTSTST